MFCEQQHQVLVPTKNKFFLLVFLTHASSILVTLVTFGVYFLLEARPLTPENVFSGLALFNQLTVPLFIFPITVPIIISAMVSPYDNNWYAGSTSVWFLSDGYCSSYITHGFFSLNVISVCSIFFDIIFIIIIIVHWCSCLLVLSPHIMSCLLVTAVQYLCIRRLYKAFSCYLQKTDRMRQTHKPYYSYISVKDDLIMNLRISSSTNFVGLLKIWNLISIHVKEKVLHKEWLLF